MFDNFDEIKHNPYLNNFVKITKDFGLFGRYVEYKGNVDADKDGIYFIYGFNKDKIYGKIDLQDIFNERAKDGDFLHYECFASKITGGDPFAVHQKVVDNCRHAEFAKKIHEEYNLPLPPKISINGLLTLKMLYVNARNPELLAEIRQQYENAFKDALKIENGIHNPQHPEYEKDDFIRAGYYDSTKGKLHNLSKKLFSKDYNKVSLEHLISECSVLGKYTLNIRMVDPVQKELRKHPEILYWISEPNGSVFKVPEGQGYGPEKKHNDTRTVTLAFNDAYYNDVVKIINKLCYPDGYKYDYNSMTRSGEPLFIIGVHKQDYRNFSKLCFTNDVQFCIDNDVKKQEGDILNIVIKKSDLEAVDAILQRLCKESEQFHISIPNPEPGGQLFLPAVNFSQYQKSLNQSDMTTEERMLENVKNMQGGGDWVVISNTLTDER